MNCLLAIESAIRGGSIALFRDAAKIDARTGNADISKAEDLLPKIAEMLSDNELKPVDLDSIAVSVGPGSFTGIRIGIATVLGLRRALSADCFGVSVLAAMAASAGEAVGGVSAAVIPVGRTDVAWQIFKGVDAVSDPASGTIELCLEAVRSLDGPAVVFHEDLFEENSALIRSRLDPSLKVTACSTPAAAIGSFALRMPASRLPLEPFYLQSPRHRSLGTP